MLTGEMYSLKGAYWRRKNMSSMWLVEVQDLDNNDTTISRCHSSWFKTEAGVHQGCAVCWPRFQVVPASRGSAPSNRIWNNTTLHSPKQQIWLTTTLCGGWCRRMAPRNLRVVCQKRQYGQSHYKGADTSVGVEDDVDVWPHGILELYARNDNMVRVTTRVPIHLWVEEIKMSVSVWYHEFDVHISQSFLLMLMMLMSQHLCITQAL